MSERRPWIHLHYAPGIPALITEHGEIIHGVQNVDLHIEVGQPTKTTVTFHGVDVVLADDIPSSPERSAMWDEGYAAGRCASVQAELEAQSQIAKLEDEIKRLRIASVLDVEQVRKSLGH